jgi:hypothetical protein
MANTYGSPQTNPYPQTEFLDTSSKRPTRPWQQFFLNMLNFSSTTTTPALPSSPAGYMQVTVNGKQYKVPFYNL